MSEMKVLVIGLDATSPSNCAGQDAAEALKKCLKYRSEKNA